MNKSLYILLFLIGFSQSIFSQEKEQTFSFADSLQTRSVSKELADSFYAHNDYRSAIEMYEQLIATKGDAAEVYFNLGNAYFKVDNLSKSILNYERALLLQPNNKDILFNLELARSKTVDKTNVKNELFFVSWAKAFSSIMGVEQWAICGIICFIILILSLSIFIFSKKRIIKKIFFIFAIVSLMCTIIANIIAGNQKSKLVDRRGAIITEPSVIVRSTPSAKGTELFILHEGRKVFIKDDTMKEWKEIELEDGNVGWLPVESMERI